MSVLSQEVVLDNENTITKTVSMDWPRQFKKKLLFSKGVLSLLKETNCFGPMIDKALRDMDFLIQKMDELAEIRLLEIRVTIEKTNNP